MNNNIILIGFMGSGKTTFGKWISETEHMAFLDTDDYIEAVQNRRIKDIFAEDGEEAFRNMETETIKQLCKNTDNTVISVGGGLPVRAENRTLLKQLGTVVYLQAGEEELAKRLNGDTKRPLLAGTDVKVKIHELMNQREALYQDAADLVISTEKKAFATMYEEIQNKKEKKRRN